MICEASVQPLDLLDALLAIEIALGRDRSTGPSAPERFGPRVIDLDVLLFGNEVVQSKRLEVPHPRMKSRAFVLVPLAEIASDLVFPDGSTIGQALGALEYEVDGEEIRQ